jgi:RDD family
MPHKNIWIYSMDIILRFRRISSYLVDYIIVLLLFCIYGNILNVFYPIDSALYSIVFLFSLGMHVTNIVLTKRIGGSPGKRILKLKVLNKDQNLPTWAESTKRYLPVLCIQLSFMTYMYKFSGFSDPVYDYAKHIINEIEILHNIVDILIYSLWRLSQLELLLILFNKNSITIQ